MGLCVADFVCAPRFLQDVAEWEKTASPRDQEALVQVLATIVADPELRARVTSFYDRHNPSYLHRGMLIVRRLWNPQPASAFSHSVFALADRECSDEARHPGPSRPCKASSGKGTGGMGRANRLGGPCNLWLLLLRAGRAAAAIEYGLRGRKQHRDRVQLANRLHKNKGLPDVSKLLTDLHNAQKYASYGDVRPPRLVAENVAHEIEEFVEAVAAIVK